jgi:hypothetical protein
MKNIKHHQSRRVKNNWMQRYIVTSPAGTNKISI